MFDRRAKSAVLLVATVLVLCSAVGCTTTRPPTDTAARAAARTAAVTQSSLASPSTVTLSSPPAASPTPSTATPSSAAPTPAPHRTKSAPARSTSTILAPPPVILAGPAFAVSATSAPTAVSAPSTVGHWNICIPVTLHATNNTGAVVTAITINPTIQSRSPGGQIDTLVTTPDYYTVARLDLGDGHSATTHVNVCGYIYNGASQIITYTGTAQMTGGYAAPGALQQLPGPAGGRTVAITMS